MLINTKRLRVKIFTPLEWVQGGCPFWAWVYSLTNHESRDGDHVLQLSVIGINIAIRHKIIDKP